jgi:hypothetical protein
MGLFVWRYVFDSRFSDGLVRQNAAKQVQNCEDPGEGISKVRVGDQPPAAFVFPQIPPKRCHPEERSDEGSAVARGEDVGRRVRDNWPIGR